ncbi:zinc finger CCCH domain-containing protein 7B-like [Myripristis murdjan]|uniref:Zinc finger CCCH-type containing 7B n=1 Tax=Myripristis murdjan TaxID=586833 RepID=A0A667WFD3_9TELE|nr:zinc finger CCCH domain-containing protein 7B-like [Myripristis murdjan]
MEPARQKRREEIQKALTFIQSSLPYPDPEGYKDFLTQLVWNLLEEGTTSFKDNEWGQAVKDFSEGLNIVYYAASEEIDIPKALLESLYVNRATAYHSMGQCQLGVQDCDRALEVCKESRSALYRKALCLKELGQYKEAYNCTTDCLLITRLDKQVNDLAQELAIHLGLKNRKPYVSAKEEVAPVRAPSNGNMSVQAVKVPATYVGNGLNPLSGIAPVIVPSMPQSSIPVSFNPVVKPSAFSAHNSFQPISSHQPAAVSVPNMDTLDDFELGDDLDSLLDCYPNEPEPSETHIQAAFPEPNLKPTRVPAAPTVLPAPTPRLPPAFFNSATTCINSLDTLSAMGGGDAPKVSTLGTLDGLDALDSFSSGPGGDAGTPNLEVSAAMNKATLDTLDGLDSLDDLLDPPLNTSAREDVGEARAKLHVEEKSLDESLDCFDTLETVSVPAGRGGDILKLGGEALDQLDSLDALDSFSSVKGVGTALPAVPIGGGGLDTLSDFSLPGVPPSHSAVAAPATRTVKNNHKNKNSHVSSAVCNPLSATHDFMPACSLCFPREGQGIYTFVHKPDLVHTCKRDILLCRKKAGYLSEWTRVRPIPTWTSFSGPFVLCRELLKSGDLGLCKFGEKCTFAFNQLEIDVWTEERKGTLDRSVLFDPTAVKLDPVYTVTRLLQEHKGMFLFLCQECYDSKPTIISRRCRDDKAICSNLHAPHAFDDNKCLAYMMMNTTVNYRKIRQLHILCHLDLCRQAVRYGCLREDSCHFAHSVIELKTWRMQRDTGITVEEIVKESIKYYEKQEQNSAKQKVNKPNFSPGAFGGGPNKPLGGGKGAKSLNLKMKFACAGCWLNGLISEPDKALKYCTARARHAWTKERRVLLVKSPGRNKWVQVRPLPHAKNYPLQYDLCTQILEKRKCTYTGNCTFAHSQEEKELWTYMKNNDLRDMQQIYDMWLSLANQNRQSDGTALTQSNPLAEEKCIVMPTDYADPMSSFHCRLCGRHSNSERQWQQHISSEKHKDRVFSCEGEDESLTWSYRFPGPRFEICPKLDSECPEGASCDFAHSPEELQEWLERRDFLRRKLAKAREDMLIMPDELDFGKYNFLLQD